MKSRYSILMITALIVGSLLSQAGCAESAQEPVAATAAPGSETPAGMVRGTVLETMNAGGYTYVFIDAGQDKRWVAARQMAVQVGDIVQSGQGMAMVDFTSNSLQRTFDLVYFVSALENLSAAALPDGHPATALPAGHPAVGNASGAALPDTSVAELTPGQNIAYVYANKDSLANQQISLRGKVVKYNAGILGWNFIHIQDGSGNPADGSHDLTVTSKAGTAVGETVVLTGRIILNKDFGSGYSFPVLMEGATLSSD